MAIRAFVLIEAVIGKTREVADALQKIPGVTGVEAVTGPYDIIAQIEGADVNSLGEVITKGIHGVSGIIKTTTCIAVKASEG